MMNNQSASDTDTNLSEGFFLTLNQVVQQYGLRERETKVLLRRNLFFASMWKATANKLHINYLIIFNKCSLYAHFTCRKAPTKVGLVLINCFWEPGNPIYLQVSGH